MASFEPRGLGIKKEVYSRKSYSGVSVSIRDKFKTGTTKHWHVTSHLPRQSPMASSLITGVLKLRFP